MRHYWMSELPGIREEKVLHFLGINQMGLYTPFEPSHDSLSNKGQ